MSTPRAIPILPSSSLSATAAFYARLGFVECGRWENEYLIVERDGLELHFFPLAEVDPATSNWMCFLRVEDSAALYEEFSRLGLPLGCFGAPRVQGPPDADGEFAVIDPDGTLLRIGTLRQRS